jgi:hypothetical protein
MPDQIIDARDARAIQAKAGNGICLFGWIVMKDQPDYPGKLVARLATSAPTVYVMLADTLDELRAMLPAGLVHSARELGPVEIHRELMRAEPR